MSTVAPRPGDPAITPELVAEHGLTSDEFDRLVAMLGRTPTFTELGIVSALWSEHCSYKHSRNLLKTLPTEAPHVLQGPGENAGVISIGDGFAVAFKIESHNHPSAVEPYQGAATGVGGILRDVFTMGARPIAMLNSLRFGSLDNARVRYLFSGVVKGIGDYGNCVGIPTVAGEIVFDAAYEGNPLVNAMCVGLMHETDLIRAKAEGVGNPIIAVGAKTGRDGIHGASFASEDLSAASDARRPRVQVGDPFTEKLLLEASLELIKSGYIVAIQDMGAAGLTSSSAEMAERGDVGVTIDVTKVPVRESGMTPYEILLSESQERMLVVAHKGKENDVHAILAKWDLDSAVIGEVIAEPVYRVTEGSTVVAEFPGSRLVTECPRYTPEAREDSHIIALRSLDVSSIEERPEEADPAWTLLQLLASPSIASKSWAYQQYDSTVRTNTVIGPGGDAAALRIRGTNKAIAVKTDCNGRYTYLNPKVGGQLAVVEAARNVACTGARPMAITNCLNFGNPRRPEVFFQLREAISGMGEACRVLGTPVTGGNVSLYNENPSGAVYPTPVVGMVGLIDSLSHVTRSTFSNIGDTILLMGSTHDELGGTEYLATIHGVVGGEPPSCDLAREKAAMEALHEAIVAGAISSAHDCSDGGLAVALAEACIANTSSQTGASIDLDAAYVDMTSSSPRGVFFGETQGRYVLSSSAPQVVEAIAKKHGIAIHAIGIVLDRHDGFSVRLQDKVIKSTIKSISSAWHDAIPAIMSAPVAASIAVEPAAMAAV
ncbi:MAG: phosphoribosylformylglycinamidine synthase subunit PurL [Gemmatimonadaceae bacterium]